MRNKRTYEEIENIASQYSTLKDFIRNEKSAYNIAVSNGWMSDFIWLKRINNKWTRENCEIEARKYKTMPEFINGNSSAYKAARKNGWLEDYTFFEIKKLKKDLYYIITGQWAKKAYEEAKKYTTYVEFRKQSPTYFTCASFRGWLKEYDWLTKQNRGRKCKH